MYKDKTVGTIWVGEVINSADPLKLGRVKIRIFGKYDELDEEVIPWSIPYNQLSSGTVIIPKIGEICNVFFENGDENIPFYMGIAKPNDDLLGEYDSDFPKVWSLVYDKRIGENGKGKASKERTLEIFYTESQGLMIRKNDTFLQFKNEDESVLIKNGKSQKVINISDDGISLGTEGTSDEPAVLGQTLDELLVEFVKALGKVQPNSPAGPCTPLNTSPFWTEILGKFDKLNTGWETMKSKLVTLDKDK